MGKRGRGGGSNQTTINSGTPWEGQIPYLRNLFTEANRQYLGYDPVRNTTLSGNPQKFFESQTYAPSDPATIAALNSQEQRARAGSPLLRAAQGNLKHTLSPEFLHNNQDFMNYLSQKIGERIPGVGSQFNRGGALNSSMAAQAYGKAIADETQKAYIPLLAMQQASRSEAPGLAAQDYYDFNKLGQVGAEREDIAQQAINEAMARHEFGQNEPWDRLAKYAALVGGGTVGGTQTTVQNPFRGSRAGGILGGALGGASTGATVGGPWGAGIGGILGGILGGYL